MDRRIRSVIVFGLAIGLVLTVAPIGFAQKPPAPPAPTGPPAAPAPRTTNPLPSNLPPNETDLDFVMYLEGTVAADDGTHLPTNVIVERLCNATVRQQVYATSGGDFTMHLGSVTDGAPLDASAVGSSQQAVPNKFSETGIPRRDLANCELRASAFGFQPRSVPLVEIDPSTKSVDVGRILMHRTGKVEGGTLNAAAYKAPKDALSAYEKGLDAERSRKASSAQKYFEKAVAAYPAYAHAWFQLGIVLEQQNEKDAARNAYTRATAANGAFLPPYLSLAVMAAEEQNWKEVLKFTGFILARYPFKDMAGYTMELDPVDCAQAYFYSALASYKLSQFADAERNGLKAEHLLARSPQLHLLLGELFAKKADYASAISELQTYLDLLPNGKDAEQARARLAEFKRRNDSGVIHQENTPD